jgi:hypothetical protein
MPMLHKIDIQRHKVPLLSLFLLVVLKISIEMQMCSTNNGEIFPTSTISLFRRGWIANDGVDYDIN